jgi:hypothetical protein
VSDICIANAALDRCKDVKTVMIQPFIIDDGDVAAFDVLRRAIVDLQRGCIA